MAANVEAELSFVAHDGRVARAVGIVLRFADPQECGDLIAFLCSAQSGFMTGQNIINDGGVYQGLF